MLTIVMINDMAPRAVFTYRDFRTFLKDYYTAQKSAYRGFSYRAFSKAAGLTSPSALREVITGKIGITRQSLPRYLKGLGLKAREAAYFRELVRFNQAGDEETAHDAYLALLRIRRTAHAATLMDSQFEYCSEWYYSVVRSLVGTDGFRNDPEWIARTVRPAITPARARKAVAVLLRLGLVRKTGDGCLEQADAHLDIDPEIDRLAVRRLNRSMIRQAERAVTEVAPADREISHATIGLSRDAYRRLQAKVRAFKAEVLTELAESGETAGMVCQLNLQLFPFTAVPDADTSENH